MSNQGEPIRIEDYYTMTQFAEKLGVSRQRVVKLVRPTKLFPEGRIVGVRRMTLGGVRYTLIPKNAQILRHPQKLNRGGKVTDYIDNWERRRGWPVDPEPMPGSDVDPEAWRESVEGFFPGEESDD